MPGLRDRAHRPQRAAFAELAPLGAGLINVRYQYLADPALPGPVTMEVEQGSSQYWLALLADNTGNPLASVQVETASGGWVNLARANYNYWIAQSGAGSGPFTVRLTDTQGHTVTVRNIALDPGAVQSTGTYMYGAGSTQTAPPRPPPRRRRQPRPPLTVRLGHAAKAAVSLRRHRRPSQPRRHDRAPVTDPSHHLLTGARILNGSTIHACRHSESQTRITAKTRLAGPALLDLLPARRR